MLASHAALCLSTGSLEILVFQTLFAGNMGQFGGPGTTVPMTGAGVLALLRCPLAEGGIPHPARSPASPATTEPATMPRRVGMSVLYQFQREPADVITYGAEYVIDTTKINIFERSALGVD
jgi:hypothetical protein